MKMGHSLFWGILLIVLGLSLVIRIVFNVDFPLFKIFVAFVLIYFGIKILFGSFGTKIRIHGSDDREIIFGERNFSDFEENGEYSTVFGKSTFDFRGYDLRGQTRRLKISTVFGGTEIKIDENIPAKIRVESAFAGADLPNGNAAVFGSTTYETPNYHSDQPYLDLKLEIVFGGVSVKTY
jgi:predicted membrane protein